LQTFDRFHSWEQIGIDDTGKIKKGWVPCCPVTLEVEGVRFGISERSYQWRKTEEGFESFLSIPIAEPEQKYRIRCAREAVDEDYPETGVHWQAGTVSLAGLGEMDLAKAFTQKANLNKPWLAEVPAQPIRSVLKELAEVYRKWRWGRKAGKPKFKFSRRGDLITSLIFEDADSICKTFTEEGLLQKVKILRLGDINIQKAYQKRWGKLPITTVKLVWDCGWQLHLTSSLKPIKPLKAKEMTAEIEIIGKDGVLFKDDRDREYKLSLDRITQLEAEIEQLQQQIQRQKNRMKTGDAPSARLIKNQKKLRQLHRKLRLSRKSERTKLAACALRRVGSITIIDKSHRMVPVPDPVVVTVEPGEWEKNGREEVCRINQAKRRYATNRAIC
jgi:hypothetical protein